MRPSILLLSAAAVSAVFGAFIVSRPELALGHVIGALLVGLSVALAAVGTARALGRRVGIPILGAYAGAVLGAIASRLWLGFRPTGVTDAVPWLLVMALAGPILAAAETPLLVLAGAAAGLALALLLDRRVVRPIATTNDG